MSQHEDKREIYQQNLEMELLTEGRLGKAEWARQAQAACSAYTRSMPKSDPYTWSRTWLRLVDKVQSIAEVQRAAKEGWGL